MSRFDRLADPAPKLRHTNRPRPRIFVGQIHGQLTVEGSAGPREKDGEPLWACRCSCGKLVSLTYRDLLWYKRKSCGIAHRRPKHMREKKKR